MQRGSQRILLVGAYERDNFGDILFQQLTEHYLAGAEVTAAAPSHADMTEVSGRYIPAYGPLLREQRWDTVWCVGGEIGRVNLPAAFKYSMAPALYRMYRGAQPEARKALDLALSGGIDPDLVYVPTMGDFPLNRDTELVINSAGLSGIGSLQPAVQGRYLKKLRAASAITVRDSQSSDYLSAAGIAHQLSPDLVHAISHIHPASDVATSPNICVHASAGYLNAVGHDRFAESIAALALICDSNIVLFIAGTAAGHDSVEGCRQVAQAAARRQPRYAFTVSDSRDPMDLVTTIRRSRAWIGTSLHGRIVAESYGVPRISLSKAAKRPNFQEKTAVYAATWDKDMPYAVPLEDLLPAARTILAGHSIPARTSALAEAAHDSMVDLTAAVTHRRRRADAGILS